MRRFLLYIVLPVLAIAGPPLALGTWKWWKSQGGRLSWPVLAIASSSKASDHPGREMGGAAGLAAAGERDSPSASEGRSSETAGPGLGARIAPAQAVPAVELAEALRFDITPGWVMTRWPRVSAGLAELQLQGYRVPLVTGTAEDDLAGALTYYFDPRQQVARITFRGTTGNAGKLIEFLVQRYRFARRLTNNPQIVRFEVAAPPGQPHSWLEIRPAGVVKADEPYRRLGVTLVLHRPEE